MHTIFLFYANTPLRGSPENLLTITDTIDEKIPMQNPWHLAGLDPAGLSTMRPFAMHGEIIKWIIHFAERSFPYAEAIFSDMTRTEPRPALEIAFEAVHGYGFSYCFDDSGSECFSRCLIIPERKALVDDASLYGPEDHPGRLQCLECDQLYFMAALQRLIEGEQVADIPGLAGFINQSMFFAPMFDVLGGGLTWKTGPEYPEFPYKHVFNNYLRWIIADSFERFLTNYDLRQLKVCNQCNNFFISKTSKPSKFCSAKCKNDWHNKKKIESGELKEYKRRVYGWNPQK
jgi:hypothetical protein